MVARWVLVSMNKVTTKNSLIQYIVTNKSDHDLSTMKKKTDLVRPDYALK